MGTSQCRANSKQITVCRGRGLPTCEKSVGDRGLWFAIGTGDRLGIKAVYKAGGIRGRPGG